LAFGCVPCLVATFNFAVVVFDYGVSVATGVIGLNVPWH
jgi:hypothetical protein